LKWWGYRPHPEECACRRRTGTSIARARVSKDEDAPPSAPFETHLWNAPLALRRS